MPGDAGRCDDHRLIPRVTGLACLREEDGRGMLPLFLTLLLGCLTVDRRVSLISFDRLIPVPVSSSSQDALVRKGEREESQQRNQQQERAVEEGANSNKKEVMQRKEKRRGAE